MGRLTSADVAAKYRVLVPEHQQLSIPGPVPAEHHDNHGEYPANQQVDDLERGSPQVFLAAPYMILAG